MSHEPAAVRALFLKAAARGVESLPPQHRTAHDALQAVLVEVKRASALQWLPVEHLLRMNAVAVEVMGEAGARQLILDTMGRAMGAPRWRAVVARALRLFGVTPTGMARWVPSVYRQVFRDTGSMHVSEADADQALVRFEDVPRSCIERPDYVVALGHALEFFFVLCQRPGSVEVEDHDPDNGLVSFRLRLAA